MKAGLAASLMLSAVLTLAPIAAPAANERGFFGFQVNVETDGSLPSPTLHSITVDKVFADSPAAKNGIVTGDQMTEIEGVAVAGRKARELESVMRKSVGQSLHLKLKRKNGETYTVDLVAVPRPDNL